MDHLMAMERIAALNSRLEEKAASAYRDGKGELKNCRRCGSPPIHSYDSFGMPMHKLSCRSCGYSVEWPKEWDGVKRRWNALQEGEKPWSRGNDNP